MSVCIALLVLAMHGKLSVKKEKQNEQKEREKKERKVECNDWKPCSLF